MSDDTLVATPHAKPRLDYPCGEPPAPGQAREVAPGVLWLRMPLPFALDHINVYAVRDGERGGAQDWAVFDTGTHTPEVEAAWRDLWGEGGALAQARAARVFVTHMHPDHVGMAGALVQQFSGRLWMTRLEYLNCRVLAADTGRQAPEEGVAFYRRVGWDAEALEGYRQRFGRFGKLIHALPESFRRLHDGEVLQIGGHTWRVVVGRGHSPEHACFYCPELRLFISGDQVLPRISSNVSVFPTEPDADPLGEWLASLDKLRREVPDDVLVLPAHNEPFRGLHARLAGLAQSQHAALDRLRAALSEQPRRAIDVFGALFSRPIGNDAHLLGLATGESIAHLNYLVARDEAMVEQDAQGVAWYRAAG
ncbi:MBL fold metallo-hydrolase [Ramlibacter sp. H39-3-26]|uniref:MBL fold metallo-hydrolase n=1 Tax=Curvibacter soli TaxID=3031331 RepID=UPI0023DA6438|nr:MBL fold metallo-hydrolase [Ramlibacter sp. H39-3-26]MDF1485019.1 MBL fold metallo-hydrolase [Ramlibacter sp. H39-3-26]